LSETETKFVVRGHLRQFDGKTAHDVIDFFTERLGQPDDMDSDDEGINEFFYEAKKHDGWRAVSTEVGWRPGKWGVDFVVAEGYFDDVDEECAIALPTLLVIADQMRERFGIPPEDVRVAGYSWYNGVDEPICLEPIPGTVAATGPQREETTP
jgi:hypothetical protein